MIVLGRTLTAFAGAKRMRAHAPDSQFYGPLCASAVLARTPCWKPDMVLGATPGGATAVGGYRAVLVMLRPADWRGRPLLTRDPGVRAIRKWGPR